MSEAPSREDLIAEVHSLRTELARHKRIREDLDEFVFIVSHDFNAPLRAISSLIGWLAKDHAEQLDQEGQKLLTLVDERVLKLVYMIDAILAFSRIGRIVEEPEAVDVALLVPEVFNALSASGGVRLECASALPVLHGEPGRIRELFRVILDNAVYFMDKAGGEVRVGCVEEGARWLFSVADNGPGIKSKNFERIFNMFQTLEVHRDPRRVGAGLALARKIVEEQGGTIRVDSEVGRGSTFFFTWPRDRKASR